MKNLQELKESILSENSSSNADFTPANKDKFIKHEDAKKYYARSVKEKAVDHFVREHNTLVQLIQDIKNEKELSEEIKKALKQAEKTRIKFD